MKSMQVGIDNEVIKLHRNSGLKCLVILALYKGKKMPNYCALMQRDPKPAVDIVLNNNLAKIYFSAI